MLKRNKRMEKLHLAGINTGKYFTVDLDNGTKIHLIIDENGNCKQVKDDPIATQIIEDGYVRNTKLHRRWVMAQMFHALNYTSYNGSETGFNAYLKNMYGYHYTLTMMLDEIKVLSKLEQRDVESFEERKHFFTREVIVDVLNDYVNKLTKYIDGLPNKNCKGVPYKRIKGENIFNSDIDRRIFAPIERQVERIRYARSYEDIYRIMNSFMACAIKLPFETPKSKAWIDAYKGEGAYYTLKNLIMFHECGVETSAGESVFGIDAMNYLYSKLDEYCREGWRMFAFMKKVIEDNEFDFYAEMDEIYNG